MRKKPGKTSWVPVFGEFDVAKQITFKGRMLPVIPSQPGTGDTAAEEKKEQTALGLILSSHMIGDGVVTADIEFVEVVTDDTFCELQFHMTQTNREW